MFKSNLPVYARILISLFNEQYDSYFLWGDVEEVFNFRKENDGILRAHLWLILQLVKSIPPIIFDNLIWSLSMIKNYLKIAYRNIVRNKVYSFINITGLSIGLVCCILIYLFVDYELSFDKHQTNFENIYRVVSKAEYGGETVYNAAAPFPMAKALRNDIPDLLAATQVFYNYAAQIKVNDDVFLEDYVVFTDTSFSNMFDCEFLVGDKNKLLHDKSLAIITESLAKKYFGNKSPLGEKILLDNLVQYNIAGILKDPPKNSNLPFSMLLPLESATKELLGMNLDTWKVATSSSNVFVLLSRMTSVESFNPKFEEMKKKYLSENKRDKEIYSLQPLSEMHYDSKFPAFRYTMNKDTIYIFLGVAIIILIIAGVNYVNLSTAQSVKRSKEVGMRKVLGAHRKQLVRQFIGETTVYTTLAFLLALIISEILVGYVNDFLDNGAALSLLNSPSIILPIIVIYIASILLAGFYPSIVLSAYSPAEAFNKKVKAKSASGFSLRNGLVVFQFVVSQVLIICTIVVSTQMDFFRNKDLGFRKNEIVSVPLADRDHNKNMAFTNSLKTIPSIENVTIALGTPTSDNLVGTGFEIPGLTTERIPVQFKVADENYIDIFDLKLVAGRFYNKHVQGDTVKTWVVNECLLRKAGISNPQEAIGKFMSVSSHRGEIIGVVKDFHNYSLQEEISPLVFTNKFERFFSTVSVKFNSAQTKQTINAIEEKWNEFFPEYTFSHEFFDEYLHQLYETEDRLFSIIKVFAGIAIFIGCLGLLGLISFTVVQKTKEIGIRKVLGASSGNIVLIITKEFLRNGLIACFVAWPIAFYFMNDWLNSFAYSIQLSLWMFLSAGAIGLLIILFSVSFQSLKAAVSNPIDSIKYE
jgi:putative ABC transport system permease protein